MRARERHFALPRSANKKNTMIETPFAIGAPFAGTLALHEDAVTQRDALCKDADTVTEVKTEDDLVTAVAYLRDINALLKITEEGRKKEKRPHIDYNKLVDDFAAKFSAPLDKVKLKLTGFVNHFQRRQLEDQRERERVALAEHAKAQLAAAVAQREIERQQMLAKQATTKQEQDAANAKKLAAELDAEEAALNVQSASLELSAPTNTPKGLTTRVRYDFEIIAPKSSIFKLESYWTWHPGEEVLKFNRAAFLKALNNGAEDSLLPEETQQSVVHSALGIRVYSDIRTHVR